MKLECYPVHDNPPSIIPGRADRKWMDAVAGRAAYRCLPMTIANTTGWEILCPFDFEAEWNGGLHQSDIIITSNTYHAGFAVSHFAYGILTLHPGYLFKTPPGWAVYTSGAPNHIKHGIQPLQGIVETDWLPFTFTMNWMFTAPGRIRFEKDEPFCFINVLEHKNIEQFEPVIRKLIDHPELKQEYDTWNASRLQFNSTPHDDKAWQKHYFQGKSQDGKTVKTHVSKRHINEPKIED